MVLIGHRSQMERSGLPPNRAKKKKVQSGLSVQKKRKGLVLLTCLTARRECCSLDLESQKFKDINSKSVLSELFYIGLFSDFPPKSAL